MRANPFCGLLGLTQEQCSGLGVDARTASRGCRGHGGGVAGVRANWRELWYREHRILGIDGTYHRGTRTRVCRSADETAEITGWAGINLDISRLKRTEEALREADRRKDEFLATLAHELRNPLAPIRHAVEAARVEGRR